MLEALAQAVPSAERDDYLTTKQTLVEYRYGHESIVNAIGRGELAAVRGKRNQILVLRSEMERYIASKPFEPKRKVKPAADLDAWDKQAERKLMALQGGRRG
ncbi:MAG TPA: hypothetical protein VJN18_25160 [Polyangiaceae bacterium]|nr:hypothetical protein [Polyangiaceae bacterium]